MTSPSVIIRQPRAESVTLRQEGNRVLVIVDGRAVLDVGWRDADKICNALRAKARAAEEHEKAEQIAYDNAILLRAGVPLGLSNHPKIREETIKQARDDRNLRRYMPGGIKSKELFGTPIVIVHPPKRTSNEDR